MSDINNIALRAALLKWFAANKRDLPWRHSPAGVAGALRDPYWVVVSEVMLQQTQVTTVIPYFNRWMTLFPDFKALTDAPLEQVLKAWEGLGYYTRARNLKKLAERVVALGGLPRTASELEDLPGIGRYSSRSIASLAWGQAVACVDGNLVRVLSRLRGIERAYKSASAAQHDFQPIADEVLNPTHPDEHNEAMMELGALICTKAAPKCEACPFQKFCWAYKNNAQERLPVLEKVKTESRFVKRVWMLKDDALLLEHQDGTNGQLKDLYELPRPDSLNIKKLPTAELLRRTRSITKYKITEVIYAVNTTAGLLKTISASKTLKWVKLEELKNYPLSGPHAQWIELLLNRKTEGAKKKVGK